MIQFYKHFLLSGTKDKAFSSVLEKDIVGNINNFIFGESSADRIKDIISDYCLELEANKIAVVSESRGVDLSTMLDNFTRLSGNYLEFFTNISDNDNTLFTMSSMQNLVEINDYSDLIKDRAVSDNEEVDMNRFYSLKRFMNLFKSYSKHGDNLKSRIYAERKQIDIPGETNCYIYNIQSRIIIGESRVVYNHFCLIRNDNDYSLQLLDKEYNLDILQENNKTINQVYLERCEHPHVDLETVELNTNPKYKYVLADVLNKNMALFNTLESQLAAVEEKYTDRLLDICCRVGEHLNSAAHVLEDSTRRIYALNKNLSLKEVDIALTAVAACAINYNVFERNITFKIAETIGSINSKDPINTIKLCVMNVPKENLNDQDYNYQEALNYHLDSFKERKILEVKEVSGSAIISIYNDLWNMLEYFIKSFDDLIVKSMYAENTGLYFKAPENQEDRITMLIAAGNIAMIDKETRKALSIDNIRAKDLIVLKSSTRRLSNIAATAIYNSLITDINRIIGFINVEAKLKAAENTEKVIEKINSLTIENIFPKEEEK